MIGSFLFAWLAQDAGVIALIKTGGVVRAYPGVAPERAAYPHVTYTEITGDTFLEVSGMTGLCRTRVQIDCWGRGPAAYLQVQALGLAIRGTKQAPKLNGYRGTLGGVTVQAAWLEGRRDSSEPPVDATDETIYGQSLDFAFVFEEP